MTTATEAAWRVRHTGSPRSIDGLTPAQIAEGLQEGQWETNDEVRGPDDAEWQPIEEHPLFADAAADIEPPPVTTFHDEANLDMNPLIDVCLVLLVFFILTTSYAALQARLQAADAEADKRRPKVTPEQIDSTMILVEIRQVNGQPQYTVQQQVVPEEGLEDAIRKYVSTRSTLLMDYSRDPDVTHGAVVKVQDAATGAGVQKLMVVVP